MRLFISEYITSGALADQHLPSSLLREGRAMRDAIIADFAACAEVQVLTTCDTRIPPPDRAEVLMVQRAADESVLFQRLVSVADVVYVIAPELDGVLLDRVQFVESRGRMSLNCRFPAVELTADKPRSRYTCGPQTYQRLKHTRRRKPINSWSIGRAW
ncbi:MAG: hypothetical protein R3B90_17675 [Planctomycetaceae bacterium]